MRHWNHLTRFCPLMSWLWYTGFPRSIYTISTILNINLNKLGFEAGDFIPMMQAGYQIVMYFHRGIKNTLGVSNSWVPRFEKALQFSMIAFCSVVCAIFLFKNSQPTCCDKNKPKSSKVFMKIVDL